MGTCSNSFFFILLQSKYNRISIWNWNLFIFISFESIYVYQYFWLQRSCHCLFGTSFCTLRRNRCILCPKWTTSYRINVVKCVCVHWIETYVWDRKAYLICIISLLIFTWKINTHSLPAVAFKRLHKTVNVAYRLSILSIYVFLFIFFFLIICYDTILFLECRK